METALKDNAKILITNKGVTPTLLIGDLFSGKGKDNDGISIKENK